MNNILYISLTGMTEPLGRSQVLEYLIDLSKKNKIYLISFEREQDLDSIDEIKVLTSKYDIEWNYLIYSNKYGVLSTLGQIFKVFKIASKIIKNESIKIIHARSMIPATIGILLKKVYGVKLLFDIRGFAIDEKLDSGRLKKNSLLFKSLKMLDNYLYKKSDHVVTLTHKAKDILHKNLNISNKQITVIPTCASREVFKTLNIVDNIVFKKSLGYKKNDKIIIHTGTVSGWYDFNNEVKLIKELMLQDSNIRFLILNKHEHDFILETINALQLDKKKVQIMSSSFIEMYKYLSIADYSIFFIKPSYSKQASAPTKFAENVACILPSITNTRVGDMEYYLNKYDTGYLVNLSNISSDLELMAKRLLEDIETKSVNRTEYNKLFNTHFDKEMAVKKYQSIYESL